MNEEQREVAERLIVRLDTAPAPLRDPDLNDDAAALLRELLAEPLHESKPTTASQFESVKQAKRAAEYELRYYTKMMKEKNAAPQQPMRCPEDGGACGAGGYCRPEQRKPLTPSMQAEVECDCLVAWNASTYGHSAQDTVHPMFLSAFLSGYRAAERAHDITGEPT
jgi:hypothetical protein